MKDYYQISEVAKLYNIGQDSLRYYEKLGILEPTRSASGYRLYSIHDMYRLSIIKDMRNLGFSMAKIKAYLEKRSVENSFLMFQDEIAAIDEKMKQLQEMRDHMVLRQKALRESNQLQMETMEISYFPKRKCVTLKTTTAKEDVHNLLLTKLSKEYENNLFVIANFNTGCMIEMKDGEYAYQSVFILGDDLVSYEFELEEGMYLTLSYRGKKDEQFEHLKMMDTYLKQHGYEKASNALELLIIDAHESADPNEYITQLQIYLPDQI